MIRIKLLFSLLTFLLFLFNSHLYAQQVVFQEDFEDQDLTQNPEWTGDLDEFTFFEDADNTLLQLDGTGNRAQLHTNSSTSFGTWEFYLEVPATSGLNRVYVYLISDEGEFDIVGSGSPSSANGYAIHTGSGNFTLERIDNGDDTTILTADTEIQNGVGYQIRVVRSDDGDWQIYVGEGYGSTPELDSGVVNDNTYTSSEFFGPYVRYSSGNSDAYFFDDFIITEEVDELIAEEVSVTRADQIQVTFNNDLDESTVEENNFSVDQGVGAPNSAELVEDNVVELTFTNTFEEGNYILTINDVEDEFGQQIEENTELPFTVTNPFDVVDVGAITSARVLVEFTEAPAQPLQNSNFEIQEAGESTVINPDGIEYDPGEDPNTIFLDLPSPLPIGDYTLTIKDVNSENGWPLRDENVFDFEVVNPFFVDNFEPLNRTDYRITFTQDVETGGEDVDNYSLAGVGSPETATLNENNVVLLEFADPVDEGEQILEINNLVSNEDWEIEPGTEIEFTLENTFDLDELSVPRGHQITLEFTEALNEDDLDELNFEISGIGNPADLIFDESVSATTVTLELGESLSTGSFTLFTTNLTSDFGWPLSDETDFDFEVENPFSATDFESLSRQEFDITFNQDVASFDVGNFTITGTGSPDNASLEENNIIRITYNDPIDLGVQELIINNLVSTEGWEIEPSTSIEFILFDEYEDGDLVISEFYFRTPISWRTSEFDRPQYVEVYNRTDKLLNLRDFTISGENISIETDLPISGDEYLVITRGVPVFEQQFGERNFVEADDFPALLFTSDDIIFRTNEGDLIEELTYNRSTWGGDEVSLERLSFDAPARFQDNWADSEDALTGSPGLPNTVSMPTDPPEAVAAAFPEPRTLHITFSRTLSEDSALDLSNFSLDNNAVFTSVDFTDDDRTLEFKTEEILEDQFEYTLSYQDIEDIFGNEISGTQQFNFTFENPFRILTTTLEDETRLRVEFTLPINVSQASVSDFQLSDGTDPVSLDHPNSETARLTFSEPFDVGEFEIVVNNIISQNPDISEQWQIEPNSTASFFRFDEYQPGDVVLNEFMYRPPSGYPRYVELHNQSDRFLNLRDWELRRAEGAPSNGGVFSQFDQPIEPGGFVVITPNTTQLEDVFGEGPWVQMNNYPGLTTTQPDRIRLIDSDGELVEFVDYDPSTWGGDGVALERRSLEAPVNDINNWGESESDLLGTPGAENSIGPLDEGPQLISADFVDAETVRAEFTGALDFDQISEANFSIDGGLTITDVTFSDEFTAELSLDDEMTSGTTYTLTASDIPDIFGNVLDQAQRSFTYFFIEAAEPGDVVINEFMYNEPDDYTRYIELYNASNKALDIAGWQQANNTGTRRTLTNDRTFFPPDSYLVILPNEELLNIFPDIENPVNAGGRLSALKNGGDDIVIVNNEGTTLDSLTYTPDWGGNGVALERRRIDRSPLFAENWGDSPNEMLGTPGRPNDIDRNFNLVAERVQSRSRNEVFVEFNADIRSEDAQPGNFSVNGNNPSSVAMDTSFAVLLEFDGGLNAGDQTLTIRNVRTLGGFQIADGSTFEFTVFDEFEDGDIVINEFMYRPPSGYVRYVELFNTSNKILNLRDWRLQRRQVTTESRRIISEEDLAVQPGDYIVLTPDAGVMADIFGERNYFEMATFPNFTVTVDDQIRLFTNEDVIADSLQYSPSEWGGNEVALERISADLPTELRENWDESPNPLLGTPGLPNEVSPDTEKPEFLSLELLEDRGFLLTFSKSLDPETATDPSNYQIDPSLSVSMVMLDNSRVRILVNDDLVNDQLYTITASGITDLFGNEMEPTSRSIRFLEFGDVEPQQLVINEILYRRLQAGSPEFIEIFNRSDENIDLSGWTLWDSSGSATIPSGTAIRENDYIVFTDIQSFAAESEKIIYLSGFQSLSNNGDAVVLKNLEEVTIDSLFYLPTWGNNEQGVSLERKDPSAISIDPANWAPSTDDRGSTPAEPNSRFEPDETPPEIVFVNLFHPDSLEIKFNEFVDLNIENANNSEPLAAGMQFKRQVQNEQVRILVNGAEAEILEYNPGSANRVVLDASGVQPGEENTLSIENFTDFQGNINQSQQQAIAQPISEGDIVINEIMFNPIADARDGLPDQSEYIEIHNRRDYAISLEGIFLHDEPDENNEITRINPVSSQGKWLPAGGYALFYPESTTMPFEQSRTARFFDLGEEFAPFTFQANRTTLSLPNAGRQVFLADSTRTTIDMVDYSPDWHNPNIVDTQGIALERINPAFDSNDPSNWGSNTTVLGGSPGSENSIFQRPEQVADGVGVTLDPNPFSPDGDGFEDNLFINYSLDEPDYLLRIRIYDRYGRLVRTLADSKPAGFEGSVIWDGLTDSGQTNRIGIYIIFVEAFNSANGSNLTFRETAVLARQF